MASEKFIACPGPRTVGAAVHVLDAPKSDRTRARASSPERRSNRASRRRKAQEVSHLSEPRRARAERLSWRWTEGEACAVEAEYDVTREAHAGFLAGICEGGSAQNELSRMEFTRTGHRGLPARHVGRGSSASRALRGPMFSRSRPLHQHDEPELPTGRVWVLRNRSG
jgi:hypothetical protein